MNLSHSSLVEQTSFYGADRIDIVESDNFTAFLLADGSGGMSGAKEVAEYAIEAFSKVLAKREEPPHLDDLELTLRNIDGYIQREESTGKTTFVTAIVTPTQLYGVSVGDSRCWLYTEAFQLELTAHQYRQPLLGSGSAIPVAFGPFAPQGDLFLASDGIFDSLRQPQIDHILRSFHDPKDSLERLLKLAHPSSSKRIDDISMMLCKIAPPPSPTTP